MNRHKLTSLIEKAFYGSTLGKWGIVGVLIGVISGIGSIIFLYLIQLVTDYLLGGLTGFIPPNPEGEPAAPPSHHPIFLLIPVATAIGGAIAGFLVYTFAPEAEGHGTDAAIEAFHKKNGVIRGRVPIVKMFASAFTIGSGGSGGREGPTAQIAAGFGSFIGGLFKLSSRDRRIAVAAGIGAGIGTIFKSPFGGAVLAGEILYSGGDFEAETLIPAFIASPVGYVIFASVVGFEPIFGNGISYSFTEPRNLIIYAALGILCGLAGRLYSSSFYYLKDLFARLRLPNYAKPVIGAGLAGVLGIFFPDVLGLGYGFLQFLINGEIGAVKTNYIVLPIIATLVIIALVKILATSLTVGSGGSAGVFAPSLVIGGFIGASVWEASKALLPGWIPIPAPLVIVGMMALFAGVGRVPIAVILMVSEMTNTLTLMVPSMVAVIIAYFIVGSKHTIYRAQVRNRSESPAHRGEYSTPLLERISVVDAMNTNVISVTPTDTVERAHAIILKHGFRGLPVINDDHKVVGIVVLRDLLKIPRETMASTPIEQVMTKNVFILTPDQNLEEALELMTKQGVGRLPVIDKATGKLLGIITLTDLVKTYSLAADATSHSDT